MPPRMTRRPTRITQREAAQAWNIGAPLDMPLKTVRAKRVVDPNAPREWRDVQAPCVKWLREYQRHQPNLEFVATLTEAKRDVARAAVAKMMGLKRGPHDLLLFRRSVGQCKIMWVEFKLSGKDLSDEQEGWAKWMEVASVPWARVDNLKDFQRVVLGFMK